MAACCAPSRRPTANGGSRPRSTTSIRSISPCSRPTRTAASTTIGASIRWPRRAPPGSGSRAAASCRAPRRSPCRPPACSSRGRAGLLTKAIQSARALQLEWRYSKREVLAIYLTLAPMGGNLEGVRAASFAYFGKEPQQLTAAEAALLVAIPQSPERRRPDARRHVGPGRPRPRAGARAGARRHRPGAVRQGDRAGRCPTRRLAMPMQAPHLAAWLAGQSPGAIVPTTLRFELQSALSQLVGRGARPVRRPGADRPGRDRQPHRRRRGLAGRLGLSSAAPARSTWCARIARPARR